MTLTTHARIKSARETRWIREKMNRKVAKETAQNMSEVCSVPTAQFILAKGETLVA